MPSVGHFLDLLEAISRRDWKRAEEIGRTVAVDERKKKHYSAAHQIMEAVEVLSQTSGDKIGTVAAPSNMPHAAPPDLLSDFQNGKVNNPPILSSAIRDTVDQLLAEWRSEAKLRSKGIEPRRTVLLHGPPGCGKTYLAKYLADQLKLKLFVVRFDSLLSSYLGETGQNLRKVFDYISSNRCALLIDEIDAIAKLRDDRNDLGELKRIVISLLQNIDLGSNRSLLIAATNHPHVLDPAIWRRFEVIVEVSAPSYQERLQLLERFLGVKTSDKVARIFAESTDGSSGAKLETICTNAKRRQLLEDDLSLEEAVILSLIESSKQVSYLNEGKSGEEESTTKLALFLKELMEQKYSFGDLEKISGIPKSTLHHKHKTALETA